MTKQLTLSEKVMPVDQRIRMIETEALPVNVPMILEAASLDTPDAQALDFFEDGITFTYSELQERVLDIAHGLANFGIGVGTKVAVMLPNISEFPVLWLALGRIGAVMVPVNLAYTSHELEFVLKNADVEWAFVHADKLPTIEGVSKKMRARFAERIFVVGGEGGIPFDTLRQLGKASTLPDLSEIKSDQLLNIQYTSGTTGMPKGCILTHRYWVISGKVNAFRDGRRYQRILASVPFFYMDPQWLMLMTFYHRGTLFIARRQSSSGFMTWIRKHRINFALFPEIVYKLPPNLEDCDNEIVRVNVYGLSPDIHLDLEERYNFIAREAYGMTEIGSGLFMPIEATDMVGSGSCGRPSPFREARIVDPQGNVLGDGQKGELQIRGPGIMLGYYNNPDATAAAFSDGWFRTGDLAKRNSAGYYHLVGRIKDMIRRAGENIASNEVEGVLRAMPQVMEAAVVPERDAIRDEEVKAFIVLKEGFTSDDVTPEMILDHCRQRLAKFKLPRYIAYRGPFVTTPSGKIAKHILQKEETDRSTRVYDAKSGEWLGDPCPDVGITNTPNNRSIL